MPGNFDGVSFNDVSFDVDAGAVAVVTSGVTPAGRGRKRVIFDFDDDGRPLEIERFIRKMEEEPIKPIYKAPTVVIRQTGKTDFVPYEAPKKPKPKVVEKDPTLETKALYGMILEGFEVQKQKKKTLERLKKIAEAKDDEDVLEFIQFMLTND